MGIDRRLLTLLICLVLGGGLTAAVLGAARVGAPRPAAGAGPPPGDFVDLSEVPPGPAAPRPSGPDASTGRVSVDCGRNAEGHYNEDNLVVSPGLRSGAHHTHAYVGNLSTDAFSTEASLDAAATSCAGGDRSTYYWPVLRRTDRPGSGAHEGSAGHGNAGRILPEASVNVEFIGSPVSKVVAMPRFLNAMTGDAVALTAGTDADVRARWGCSGSPDRSTTRYPRCPAGERLTRTLAFPSCWNGLDTTSPGHRSHLLFPAANGVCPQGTFPVPELRISLAYDVPPGAPIALDSFPEQRHSPRTDHAMFVNAMTGQRMADVVDCLNQGRTCRT
ncbi:MULTISPECIES: DUF1996 domain-containing protein [unclassified Streptomyces]|uniref:DUF1996 domain-containing protein n=1 Tax=unclassified Streptomyces TaxID=2593676 RepID=UPI000DC7CBFE|nr:MULTISPECIES: DUF1996 domain-containing protein [unclassified Streptomyces]AWZ08668.1 hypothetical protein DRB89_33475 [Streptomyces sp. ICC4]AWZ12692.1 hypothetical protein DRB96_10565 [Streptomyces sp. ICC1]